MRILAELRKEELQQEVRMWREELPKDIMRVEERQTQSETSGTEREEQKYSCIFFPYILQPSTRISCCQTELKASWQGSLEIIGSAS
jgi:hypothetical protein